MLLVWPNPVSVRVDTFGTATVAESKLGATARDLFDLTCWYHSNA